MTSFFKKIFLWMRHFIKTLFKFFLYCTVSVIGILICIFIYGSYYPIPLNFIRPIVLKELQKEGFKGSFDQIRFSFQKKGSVLIVEGDGITLNQKTDPSITSHPSSLDKKNHTSPILALKIPKVGIAFRLQDLIEKKFIPHAAFMTKGELHVNLMRLNNNQEAPLDPKKKTSDLPIHQMLAMLLPLEKIQLNHFSFYGHTTLGIVYIPLSGTLFPLSQKISLKAMQKQTNDLRKFPPLAVGCVLSSHSTFLNKIMQKQSDPWKKIIHKDPSAWHFYGAWENLSGEWGKKELPFKKVSSFSLPNGTFSLQILPDSLENQPIIWHGDIFWQGGKIELPLDLWDTLKTLAISPKEFEKNLTDPTLKKGLDKTDQLVQDLKKTTLQQAKKKADHMLSQAGSWFSSFTHSDADTHDQEKEEKESTTKETATQEFSKKS